MRREQHEKKALLKFIVFIIIVVIVFIAGVVRTKYYNGMVHRKTYRGDDLHVEGNSEKYDVSVKAIPRGSTWSKSFIEDNADVSEHTHRAYTYDFFITNNMSDEISDFRFKLTFGQETFLLSAWNGALEIHQRLAGGEYVATVPNLRDYDAADYAFDYITVDGDDLLRMKEGDYLNYIPSTHANAIEIPIKPHEGTVPGIILYVAIDEDFSASEVELEYTIHRLLTKDPLFWVSMVGLLLWLISLTIFTITSAQIKKYKIQHEHDNAMIKEAIETFTGFIDAKDPYTNGHSNRVAEYTRAIAQEMGYSGEELDRVYYIALLHDCGKIGVPDSILRKPEKLTDIEFEIIKSHTVHGGEILHSFKSLKDVEQGALYHHERYDGHGYPEGRAGEDIPLIARMICVADSFDAMNSNRVYRKKLSREQILAEIEKNKGKQFDPNVADIFLKLITEGKIEWE